MEHTASDPLLPARTGTGSTTEQEGGGLLWRPQISDQHPTVALDKNSDHDVLSYIIIILLLSHIKSRQHQGRHHGVNWGGRTWVHPPTFATGCSRD